MASAHSYTAELRVYGADLDPDLITRETGLTPSLSWLAGSRIGTQIRTESIWGFNGNGPSEWDSLEDALTFVLERIGAASHVFAGYRGRYDVIWWCGHFQSSFDGGPILSPRLLSRLAAFGADLFIDNYFSPAGPPKLHRGRAG